MTFVLLVEVEWLLFGELDLEFCLDGGLDLELFVDLAQTGAICPKVPQL